MSRALDTMTAASLQEADLKSAYVALSSALLPTPAYELREIEILPKSHSLPPGTFFLEEGHALAISKPALVQAFLFAHGILQRYIQQPDLSAEDDLFAATAVIILMDPEHLTAANTRKRLIRSVLSDHIAAIQKLREEKQVVDSFLTSRLHRHTKSPTVWSHRRWLVKLSSQLGLTFDVTTDMSKIVMTSGERHPRNYYAWNHAKWLIEFSSMDLAESSLVGIAKSWCFRHHTDISGWSFLHYLLSLGQWSDTGTACAVFDETLKLTASLRWTGESVWVFLRTLAASSLVGDDERSEFEKLGRALLDVAKDATGQETLIRSMRWYETNWAGR